MPYLISLSVPLLFFTDTMYKYPEQYGKMDFLKFTHFSVSFLQLIWLGIKWVKIRSKTDKND